MSEDVRALLFAAGESRRMGSPKPLLPWYGEPLVVYQVRQLREAGAAEVVVVLGFLRAAKGLSEEEVGGVELAARQQQLNRVIVVSGTDDLVGAIEALGGDASGLGGDRGELVGGGHGILWTASRVR